MRQAPKASLPEEALGVSSLSHLLAHTALFLALKLVVEQEERLFVRLRRADNREHALASLIMRSLGDGDLRTRETTDLSDLGTASPNNAAHHVGGDGDVLGADVTADLSGSGRSASGGRAGDSSGGGRSGSRGGAGSNGRERRAICGGRHAISTENAVGGSATGSTSESTSGGDTFAIGSDTRDDNASCARGAGVVQHRSETTLPVFEQAATDLFDSTADALGSALDFDDAFSGLREHVLGSNHASTRCILDGLDLESLTADDGAHKVMGNEETQRCVGGGDDGGTTWGRGGSIRFKQLGDNE